MKKVSYIYVRFDMYINSSLVETAKNNHSKTCVCKNEKESIHEESFIYVRFESI